MTESTRSVELTGEKAEIHRMTVDRGLKEAAIAAAGLSRRLGQRRGTSLSEYVQVALLRQLEADGFDIGQYVD